MSGRRLIDILVAGAGLSMMALPMTAIAVLILSVDGRPILFRQVRSGWRARRFVVVKFRTMNGACDGDGRLLPDGQRMTLVGRALRATRLDELPQLWNVLVGDMSLIGPRPLLPETIADAGAAGWSRGRIRPGLTGWAQVNGNTLLSDGDKIALDNWYITHRSLGLDLQIVARTLLVSLLGERRDAAAIGRAHARSPHRRG